VRRGGLAARTGANGPGSRGPRRRASESDGDAAEASRAGNRPIGDRGGPARAGPGPSSGRAATRRPRYMNRSITALMKRSRKTSGPGHQNHRRVHHNCRSLRRMGWSEGGPGGAEGGRAYRAREPGLLTRAAPAKLPKNCRHFGSGRKHGPTGSGQQTRVAESAAGSGTQISRLH
jgi:hypothetical protein